MNWILHLMLVACGLGSAVSSPDSKTTCNCGWMNKGRIIGGKEAVKHRYPMMAAVIVAETGEQGCGGTVITPWHVLTAAHCCPDSPSQVRIKLGVHNWRKELGEVYEVAEIIKHDKFSLKKASNDIALFVTKKEIKFSPNIGPACLPKKRLSIAGQNITILGWGDTTPNNVDGPSSDVLREITLTVVSSADCRKKWSPKPVFEKTICAHAPKKSPCEFDSGGPLLWKDPQLNRLVLVGAVSYGEGCGDSKPSVNTDVSAFIDWINAKIASSKPGIKTCTKA